MATHLVTGYAGSEHIKSEDQGSFNASFFGTGQFVMEAGNQLEASILDNNTVRILDGDILMKGRHIRINPNTYEDMIIETGTAGVNRCDLIVMEYSKDATTGIETAFLRVLKGAETAGAAEPPVYTDGNILNGAKLNQMPLYKAMIEGVVLTDIECLFETIPTYETLARKYAAEFKKEITDLKTTNILDTLEEVEANDQENMFMGALAGKELSENVDILNDARHTHSNKSVLDGITAALIKNWNTAHTNNHTHSNKNVLDGITAALISNWNKAYTNLDRLVKDNYRFMTQNDGNVVLYNGSSAIWATKENTVEYIDKIYTLPQLTWTKSGSGLYYAEVAAGLPTGSMPFAVTILSFASLRSTDVIQPMIVQGDNSKIGFLSNVNSFDSSATSVSVRILCRYA